MARRKNKKIYTQSKENARTSQQKINRKVQPQRFNYNENKRIQE